MMQTIHSTQVLESRASTGRKKLWQGHVGTDGTGWFTWTTYWQELAGGGISTVQQSEPTRIEGKNIGRANETAPKDQAYFEINSTVKKQKDHGYWDEGNEPLDALARGMLAKTYADVMHRIVFPMWGEPKYDGNRTLADSKRAWTRGRCLIPSHIVAHLIDCDEPLADAPGQITLDMLLGLGDDCAGKVGKLNTLGYTVDGELILPHKGKRAEALQKTNSAIKKYDPLTTPRLIYRLYDVVCDKPYPERYEILKRIVAASNNPQIVLTPYKVITEEADIFEYHEEMKKEGWEGIILRQLNEGYREGQRVVQLIKLKDFIDKEFQVIRVVENTGGKYLGTAKFICVTQDGKEFECLPLGSIEYKKQLYEQRDQIVGTWWTIRYQAETDDGIPTFARAINERDVALQG